MGNYDPNELKTISVSIPMWMYNWLENEGKSINRSQLFRDAVEQRMAPKMSPVLLLTSVFGVSLSISLIAIGVTPSPINVYARSLMTLLGGIMAFAVTVTYYKEKRKISRRASA